MSKCKDQYLIDEYLKKNPTPAFLKHNASASASNARTGQANRIDAKHAKVTE